jgi:oxepin-CoA hydrolase/3-oxo-5,6-dehydrosuberyl-CoA semialdehyde dehydrogenase
MITLRSYVYGEWVAGTGAATTLVNPATESPLGEIRAGGIDFARVLDHARAGGATLRSLTFGQRAALLKAVARALHANREELLDLAQASGGNTRGDAKFDVDGAIGTLSAYAVTADALQARNGDRTVLLDGEMAALTRSPRFVGQHVWTTRPGVAVHVNAFNFPAWGTFEKAAVAWLAGAPVVSKPASATALLAFRMTELLVEAGVLPEGAFQLVCGPTGDLLDRLGPMDSLAFTGSNRTGAALRQTRGFAERGVRVNVEADSLNAAVLGPDVEPGSDLFHAFVRNAVTDATQKTGQKCTAIRRVLVPEGAVEAVEEALLDAFSRVVVGDPVQDGVTMGPVATAAQLREVLAGVRVLAGEGRLAGGTGERIDGRNAPAGRGYFVAPTLVVGGGRAVHDLEVFGPCTSLLPYDGDAAAAAALVARGQGSLVASAASDDRAWLGAFTLGASPWVGRLSLWSSKVADVATPPGMVLPSCVHGGPGRAGGGEELGGERGLEFYMQRTAIQGDQPVLKRMFGAE